jgi:hypothetical protein
MGKGLAALSEAELRAASAASGTQNRAAAKLAKRAQQTLRQLWPYHREAAPPLGSTQLNRVARVDNRHQRFADSSELWSAVSPPLFCLHEAHFAAADTSKCCFFLPKNLLFQLKSSKFS